MRGHLAALASALTLYMWLCGNSCAKFAPRCGIAASSLPLMPIFCIPQALSHPDRPQTSVRPADTDTVSRSDYDAPKKVKPLNSHIKYCLLQQLAKSQPIRSVSLWGLLGLGLLWQPCPLSVYMHIHIHRWAIDSFDRGSRRAPRT